MGINASCKRPSFSLLLIHFKTILFTRVLLSHCDQTFHFNLQLTGEQKLCLFTHRTVTCTMAGLRSVHILQRCDSERFIEFGDTGGTPHIKTNRPGPGDHQEAVGAESTGDVSHIEPNKRSHGVGVEGNRVSRLVLSHLSLQGNTQQHHNNQHEYKCDEISNLEHRFLILYESFGGVAIQSQLKWPLNGSITGFVHYFTGSQAPIEQYLTVMLGFWSP